MPWIIGGAALLGAGASVAAGEKQADAAGNASGVSQRQYTQTRADLSPYRQSGELSLDKLMQYLGLQSQGGQDLANRFGSYTSMAQPDRQAAWERVLQKAGDIDIARREFDARGAEGGQGFADLFPEMQGQEQGGEFGSLLKPFGMEDFQESPAYQFNLQQGMEAINKSAAAKGKYYAPATLQDIGKYSQGLASNEFQNAFNNYNTGQNNIYGRLSGVSQQGQNAAAQTGAFGQNAANQIGENTMGAGNAQAAGMVGAANAIGGGVGDAYNAYLMSQVLGQRQNPTYGVTGA